MFLHAPILDQVCGGLLQWWHFYLGLAFIVGQCCYGVQHHWKDLVSKRHAGLVVLASCQGYSCTIILTLRLPFLQECF